MARALNKKLLNQKKRSIIRRIVVLCTRVARRDLSTDIVELITTHILQTLPKSTMRRLISGDLGRPMFEAMKRTAPFLHPSTPA